MNSGPGVVAFVLTAILLPLVVSEARDWCPHLATWLVRWAARRLGDPQARVRYEEEWAANVEAVPGKLSPLVSALGYLIALPRMRWTLRRASRPVITRPAQLPHNVTNFTGRFGELAALDDVLHGNYRKRARRCSPSHVVICGTAGTGKTALVVHWAHRMRKRFPDGTLYVNLRGFDPSPPLTPHQALGVILRALGLADEQIPHDVDAMAVLYRSVLADRRMLVVFDNVAASEQVRPLLPASPTCMVLITSRSRLSGLIAKDGAHRINLDGMLPAEATTLLRTMIGTTRADDEPSAASDLVRHCAYLPLALCIAAGRLVQHPHLQIGDLVRDLQSASRWRESLSTEDNDIFAIGTVFGWAYDVLPAESAQLFRYLAVLPGNRITSREAAALLESDVTQADKLLLVLCEGYLVEETPEPGVYRIHDLLKAYASARLHAEEPHIIPILRSRIQG